MAEKLTMITKPVTSQQLDKWKKLYDEHINELKPNKVTGSALIEYFKEKYKPQCTALERFRDVVILGAKDNGTEEPQVEVFTLDNVWVGIDRISGFFHVESENTEKMSEIWDDLFIFSGLDEDDLKNYVITGRYLELAETKKRSSLPLHIRF